MAVAQVPLYHKLLFFSDAAVIPRPTLEQYRSMIANDLVLCHYVGMRRTRVALIHTEKINEKFPHTLSYVELKKRGRPFRKSLYRRADGCQDRLRQTQRGDKGLSSPVVGNADILIFPNIESGNTVYKTPVSVWRCEYSGYADRYHCTGSSAFGVTPEIPNTTVWCWHVWQGTRKE